MKFYAQFACQMEHLLSRIEKSNLPSKSLLVNNAHNNIKHFQTANLKY